MHFICFYGLQCPKKKLTVHIPAKEKYEPEEGEEEEESPFQLHGENPKASELGLSLKKLGMAKTGVLVAALAVIFTSTSSETGALPHPLSSRKVGCQQRL